MQILIENNVTHFKRYYDNIDINTKDIYSNFVIDTEMLEDGEYTLFIFNNNNELLRKELVKIGEYKTKYNNTKKFISYVRE